MRHRAGMVLGLLWLLVAAQSAVAGSLPIRAAWRPALPDDTPARVLHDFQQGRLTAFDPEQLTTFRKDGGGSWIVLAPEPSWVDEDRVLSVIPVAPAAVTVHAPDLPPTTLRMDDFSQADPGHGRLAFHYRSTENVSAPLVLRLEPGRSPTVAMRLQLQSPDAFRQTDTQWLVFATACFSVMLTMALMALCVSLLLRDATFAWYAAYLGCFAVIHAGESGYLFHPLGIHWLAGKMMLLINTSTAMSVAFAAVFLSRFCDLERSAPLFRVPVLAWAVAMPLLVLLRASQMPVLIGVAQILLNPLLLLGTATLLLAAVTAATRQVRAAWFFLAGWTPLMLVCALSSSQASGLMPAVENMGEISLAVGAIEAIALSLGLADRALSLRRDRDKVRVLADNDALTGLFNRRAWMQQAQRMLEQQSSTTLALLFLDLDHFKRLNDVRGHQAGDRALMAVADALRAELRPRDAFGRLGGEEFVAMLESADLIQALQVATRLCRRVHRLEIPVDEKGLLLSVSIGVTVRLAEDTLEGLIERADQAMYKAKLGGRNRAEAFQPGAAGAHGRRLRSVSGDA